MTLLLSIVLVITCISLSAKEQDYSIQVETSKVDDTNFYDSFPKVNDPVKKMRSELFLYIVQELMQFEENVKRQRSALLHRIYQELMHEAVIMVPQQLKPIAKSNLLIPDIPEKTIVIVTASYNNKEWYQWNLDSIFAQKYKNWHLIYIDDCSTDGTYDLVKTYVEQQGYQDYVTIIHNDRRQKALANYYYAMHTCDDKILIIILDGDDRFTHDKVLAYINSVYADEKVWLTYGQFKEYPSGKLGFCHEMPAWVIRHNAFRRYVDTPSHLRTFYAGLFKRIKKEDLLFNGDFFPMCADLAMMFPMIEMAHDGHFRFVSEVLLEYNAANILNDYKISKTLQRNCDLEIRNRRRYVAIVEVFKKEEDVHAPPAA